LYTARHRVVTLHGWHWDRHRCRSGGVTRRRRRWRAGERSMPGVAKTALVAREIRSMHAGVEVSSVAAASDIETTTSGAFHRPRHGHLTFNFQHVTSVGGIFSNLYWLCFRQCWPVYSHPGRYLGSNLHISKRLFSPGCWSV